MSGWRVFRWIRRRFVQTWLSIILMICRHSIECTPWPYRAEIGVRLFKKFLSALVDSASKKLDKTNLSQITPAQLMRKAATVRNTQVTLSGQTHMEWEAPSMEMWTSLLPAVNLLLGYSSAKTHSRPIGVRVCPVSQSNFSVPHLIRVWTMVMFWKEDSGMPAPADYTWKRRSRWDQLSISANFTFFDDSDVHFGPCGPLAPPGPHEPPGSPGPPPGWPPAPSPGCTIVQEVSLGTRGYGLQKSGSDHSGKDHSCPA